MYYYEIIWTNTRGSIHFSNDASIHFRVESENQIYIDLGTHEVGLYSDVGRVGLLELLDIVLLQDYRRYVIGIEDTQPIIVAPPNTTPRVITLPITTNSDTIAEYTRLGYTIVYEVA